MGCRARSSRQANEAEIVGDVQCSSYAELPTREMLAQNPDDSGWITGNSGAP